MPHLCCERKSGNSGDNSTSSSATNSYAPNKVIEPVHLDINLIFRDLSSKTVKSRVTITFKHSSQTLVKSRKELSEITLNAENFENVKISGEGIANYRYTGHRIYLLWEDTFKHQEERQVTIEYELDNPVAGLYFSNGKEYINENPAWAITDHETEKARYWLPTVDFPAIRTTLTWSITAPKEYTSLANGALTSSETVGEQTTTKWELKCPCPSYLICFAVGDFIEVDDGEVDGIPVKYYAAKGAKQEDLKRSFNKTPKMISWVQKKLGYAFPWPKYYQICLPAIRGAMENTSLVTWSEYYVLDETSASEYQEHIDTVNIHEMGHTYFGNLLVMSHFDDAWLTESWATYIEPCWLQDNVSEDAFKYDMYVNAQGYFKECANYMRPIVTRKYESSWDIFDRHLYMGGSWRIHMLRQLLGEDAFWAGVQLYIQRFAKKTVKTSDFQNCLEEVSGINLTRFFDEWIHSKGYPKLKGEYGYDIEKNRVKIVLTQTQVDQEVPLFGFDLGVQVITDSKETFSSSVHFDENKTATAFIELPQGQKPSQIAIDPEFNVLFSLDMSSIDRDVLIETAKNGATVPTRIWAYLELIKSGTKTALKAVQELIKNEPFYGVRIECAAALSKLNSLFSLEILSQILDNEQHSAAYSSMLGHFKVIDDNVHAALLRFLKREKIPYRAHAAALVALGFQRKQEDLKYLLEVAKDDSKLGQYGFVRSGALKALGLHRSEEGFNYLLDRVASNIEPLRARPGAIEGLINSAKWRTEQLRDSAIEVIAGLIRDPYPSVRTYAAGALVKLKARSYTGTLSATRSLYPEDDHAWFDRTLASLKRSGSSEPELAQQQETIKKLEDRLKKLEDKLARQEDK